MELGLLQLAVTHLLAARTGSWVLRRTSPPLEHRPTQGRDRSAERPPSISGKGISLRSLIPGRFGARERDRERRGRGDAHRHRHGERMPTRPFRRSRDRKRRAASAVDTSKPSLKARASPPAASQDVQVQHPPPQPPGPPLVHAVVPGAWIAAPGQPHPPTPLLPPSQQQPEQTPPLHREQQQQPGLSSESSPPSSSGAEEAGGGGVWASIVRQRRARDRARQQLTTPHRGDTVPWAAHLPAALLAGEQPASQNQSRALQQQVLKQQAGWLLGSWRLDDAWPEEAEAEAEAEDEGKGEKAAAAGKGEEEEAGARRRPKRGVAALGSAVSSAARRLFGMRCSQPHGGGADPGNGPARPTQYYTHPPHPHRTPQLVGPGAVGTGGLLGGGGGGFVGLGSFGGLGGTAGGLAGFSAGGGGGFGIGAIGTGGGGIGETLGGLAERAVEGPVRELRRFNRAVTASVSGFLASDSGRRLSEQVAAEMSTGALMAPVYLTEELVKARVRSLVTSHARRLALSFGLRVSLASAALHGAKALARRSVRKRGRPWLRATVCFVCDVLLPTGFFGPLLGLTAGALQLAGIGPAALLAAAGFGGAAGDAPPLQPPLAVALPAVAAAASDVVAAATSGAVAAVSDAVAAAAAGGVAE